MEEGGQRLVAPVDELGVQLEGVGGFSEVVALEVQVAQFVEIADVHLLTTDLVVEVQQVDGAAHAVLAVLVRDDGAVLEQTFHQPRYRAHELQSWCIEP